MSNRLAELHRQRALVAEHLAWLDREIAASEKGSVAPPTPTTPIPVGPATNPNFVVGVNTAAPSTVPRPTAAPAPIAPSVDALLDEYRVEPNSLKSDVRKGCFLYFAAALALIALVVVILYFAFQSSRS